MNPLQDEIPSASSQETPSDIHTPVPAVVDVAHECEAAANAISKMKMIVMPSNINNMIGLIVFVPPFLDTFSQFNGIMKQIGQV